MLFHLVGVGTARASTPFPFPSLPSLLKLNPPSAPCRLTFLHLSPPYCSSSITATATAVTAAAPPNPQHKDLMVDFLVDSLGFSRNEAISISSQVTHLKSSDQPKLVLNVLLNYGFTTTQIKKIVSTSPYILRYSVDDFLKPKIKYFLQELGFSGSGFVKLIEKYPNILNSGLRNCIEPTVNYLKQELGDDQHVLETVGDLLGFFETPASLKRLQLNVALLRNYQFANEAIRKFTIENTDCLLVNPKKFKKALSNFDREVGISRDFPISLPSVFDLGFIRERKMQMRSKIFKEFGWTDLEIAIMSRRSPESLRMTEGKTREILTFFMKEVGLTAESLVSYSSLFAYGLEQRLKPRYEVYKILKEKELISGKIYFFFKVSDSLFLERYVWPFVHDLPDLYEILPSITAATPPPRPKKNKDLWVDCLVDSLGFSRDEASSLLMKVTFFKSVNQPKSVINLFLRYGLTKIQIQKIVSSAPRTLIHDAYNNLEPKLKYLLQDIRFSGSGLVKLIEKCPPFISRSLDTCIIPTFNFLKQELGVDGHILETGMIFTEPAALKKVQLNVGLLRNYGFANEANKRLIIESTAALLRDPEKSKDVSSRVDREVGISRDSPMHLQSIFRKKTKIQMSKTSKIQMRNKIFKEFGWTDLDIENMIRRKPSLTMSEDMIRKPLTFYMKEVGCTPEYLASRPTLLSRSLEKRVKPRYKVYKILKEKKLIFDKPGLYSVVDMSNSEFLERCVLRYEDELPNLYEIYRNSMKDL